MGELARAGLRNPVRINVAVSAAPTPAPGSKKSKATAGGAAAGNGHSAAVAEQKTPSTLRLQYVLCESDQKLGQLVRFLQLNPGSKVILSYMVYVGVWVGLPLGPPRLGRTCNTRGLARNQPYDAMPKHTSK